MFINTISKDATSHFVEKKSSFTAYLFRVSSEDDCKNKLLFLQNKHKDANHIPFAYRLLDEISSCSSSRSSSCSSSSSSSSSSSCSSSLIERYSDDGEPSKTAGFPLLKILRQEDLLGVAVFVVRIFGGIKLGPAGLMRAFSQSLKLALDDAGITREETSSHHELIVSVKKVASVESSLKMHKISYSIVPSGEFLVVSFNLPHSKNFLFDELSRLSK